MLEFVHDEASGFDLYTRILSDDRKPTFGFDVLSFVGVVFFPSSSLVGLYSSLVLPIDGTRPGNIFGRGGTLQREYF